MKITMIVVAILVLAGALATIFSTDEPTKKETTPYLTPLDQAKTAQQKNIERQLQAEREMYFVEHGYYPEQADMYGNTSKNTDRKNDYRSRQEERQRKQSLERLDKKARDLRDQIFKRNEYLSSFFNVDDVRTFYNRQGIRYTANAERTYYSSFILSIYGITGYDADIVFNKIELEDDMNAIAHYLMTSKKGDFTLKIKFVCTKKKYSSDWYIEFITPPITKQSIDIEHLD